MWFALFFVARNARQRLTFSTF